MKYSVIDIENIHVRSNEHGTYNLNDLHKAAIAGGLAKKWQVPSQFLQSDGIKEFVEEVTRVLKNTLEQNQILTVFNGGNEKGTWSHELIALRYAAWLSPAFEVKVYQTFRAAILGHLDKFAQANRLELHYQNKKSNVSSAAKIMNQWGLGGEKHKLESERERLIKEMQMTIPGLIEA
ncbi:KilA-N domain-containing protein (plasmid) [Arsenophonus nasoniae]|uniref:KilA-N domain protein n=1 Tax=Arsenophonus nasoniae TaxID=638 RepID=A0A4P7KTB9_9GAMM|nr:KilA-N domain-containing protein [Arsenophonus nasoniae]QBY43231.1 KilA-N domain protein [Arsenophonus nasoniae]QBY44139.1 KilA-N domain protein [Arsenophonus nasoniae]WGM00637.1 KilA-N domain-containing protein [Arsenophonus nasoniae]WGM04437.1 KilA-N domain-containing protein [Arsenophonus nasoniae]WGM06643.1 KilA-N domain-containing protein [Arsenophonus nasoniae]